MAEQLFTEVEWRAIAQVEHLSDSRIEWDGFHYWCERKRLSGPTFDAGEFYIGWRDTLDEFRVIERPSGLDFSVGSERIGTIAKARELIEDMGPENLRALLLRRTIEHVPQLAIWDAERAKMLARATSAKARAEGVKPIGKRRAEIFATSKGKCHYCAAALTLTGKWHVEHKMPRALGGSNERINLVAACAPCNHAKKDKTDLEFFQLLADRAAARSLATASA